MWASEDRNWKRASCSLIFLWKAPLPFVVISTLYRDTGALIFQWPRLLRSDVCSATCQFVLSKAFFTLHKGRRTCLFPSWEWHDKATSHWQEGQETREEQTQLAWRASEPAPSVSNHKLPASIIYKQKTEALYGEPARSPLNGAVTCQD